MQRRFFVLLISMVAVFSLALAAAHADNGQGKDKGKDKKGTTGTTGTTGATGQQGSNGNGDGDGNGNGKTDDSPAQGTTIGVQPAKGKVMIRLPGSDDAVELDGSQQTIPVGAHIDARHGMVELTTAIDAQGATQTGWFWGGVFKLSQRSGYTEIGLVGRLRGCPAPGRAVDSRRKPTKRLWGKDNHGKFRTHGQNSVATVRGTVWLTQETCRGTLTHVSQGAVSVRDLHTHSTVLVKAGHSYLAKARHSR
ncbi:MAG: hypothetical protein ACXVRH_02515 [Thermoleophilaceae bacterium]